MRIFSKFFILSIILSSCSPQFPKNETYSVLLSELFSEPPEYINLTPTEINLQLGASVSLSALGTFASGKVTDISKDVTWTSSLPNIVSVDSNGVVTGLSLGYSRISAAQGEISSDTLPGNSTLITVLPPEAFLLINLTIEPTSSTLLQGETLQLKVTGEFSDGNFYDMTGLISWRLEQQEAYITLGNRIEDSGLVTAVSPGVSTIYAVWDGFTTPSATISVRCAEAGAVTTDGIVIESTPNSCLIMQARDQAACRKDSVGSYSYCFNQTRAASECAAGTTPGPDWYLPTETDIMILYDFVGTGSPVTDRFFCSSNSLQCKSNSQNFPYQYWTQTNYDSTNYYVLDVAAGLPLKLIPNKLGASVRCVKRLTY